MRRPTLAALGLLLSASVLFTGACGDDTPATQSNTPPVTIPDAGIPGGSTAGGIAAGGITAGGTTTGGTTAGGIAAGGLTAGGITAGGTTSGSTAGGLTSGLTGGGMTGGMTGGLTGGMTGGLTGGMTGATGGTTGGMTGGLTGGGGTFPRADETVSVDMTGPYKTATYDMGVTDPAFQNGKIYYPMDAKPPFAAVSFALGFTESRDALEWWGPVLASHGIVSFHNDPTTALDVPALRADDVAAQVKVLKAENTRSGSPLMGKLDLTRLGVMGHSMGGGGTLIAGNSLGNEVKALVPLQPWSSTATDTLLDGTNGPRSIMSFPKITAATLIIASEMDELATKEDHAIPFYESITATKAYAEIKGGTHMAGTASGPMAQRQLQARLALAWLKIYLEDDARYKDYIYGAKLAEVMSQLSVFKAPAPK